MPQIAKGIVNPKSKEKSAPRVHVSMRKERINPVDFLKYDSRFSCEDCSHFNGEKVICTIGYNPALHLKAEQTQQYLLAGTMAFCRFIEID